MTLLMEQINKESTSDPRVIRLQNSQLLQQQLNWYNTYRHVYTLLEECYDQLRHPQKRRVIKKSLDATIGRMLESRRNICCLTGTWSPDVFSLMNNRTLLPKDIELYVPRFLVSDNFSLSRRNDLLRLLLERYELLSQNGSCFDMTHSLRGYIPGKGIVEEEAETQMQRAMSLEDAILLIQRAERGRAARLRAKLVQDIMKVKPAGRQIQGGRVHSREQASVIIQKYWRRALAKSKVNAMKQADLVFLGLAVSSAAQGVGSSILPIVQDMVSSECIKREKQYEADYLARLNARKDVLDKSILSIGKPGIPDSGIAASSNLNTTLTPLTSVIAATTCDGMESTYALSRYIDKSNILSNQPYMTQVTNAYDSGLPLMHDLVRSRILLADAKKLGQSAYQAELIAKRNVALRIQAELAMQSAEDVILQELKEKEGTELERVLYSRHKKAIAQFRDLNDGAIPTSALDIASPDEKLVMEKVAAEREAELLRRGLKGKKKKGKKGSKGSKSTKAAASKAATDEVVEDPDKAKVSFLSAYLHDIVDTTVEYFNRWQRHDPANLAEQPYDIEYLKESLRPQILKDVYDSVTETINAELDNMRTITDATKQLVESKKGGKGKKGKKGSKGKKGKKGKKGSKIPPTLEPPPPVGPVGDATVEAAYAELVSEGLIKAIKPARMRDFVGCDTYIAPSSQETEFMQRIAVKALQKFTQQGTIAIDKKAAGIVDPVEQEKLAAAKASVPAYALLPDLPSYNQIKQDIIANVIIPLGCPMARAVPHSNTLLIYGAPGVGKTLLSRIIATETGALVIDVSPANIVNKFPGQEIGVIFKLIKVVIASNQPAIIYFDEAELVLADTKEKKGKKGSKGNKGSKAKGKSKLPGDDAETPGYSMCCEGYPKLSDPDYNPYRLRKELLSLLKSINEYDGVLVLGCATRTMTREKAIADFFQRHIYVPLPDYNTRLKLISHFFNKMGLEQFALTGVAKDVPIGQYSSSKLSTGAFDSRRFTALGLMNLTSGIAITNNETEKIPFDLNSFAKVTEGFTAGQIQQALHMVCTPGRVASLGSKPLSVVEFGQVLSHLQPQYDSQVAHVALYKMNKAPPEYQPPIPLADPAPKKGK